MPPAKDVLVEASLDLAWSHWVGLGVRGTAQPPDTAVDPEALLYFTACLVEHDPRLRDEVADWWHRYQRHVSRPRLSAFASKFDQAVVAKFEALEDALAATKTTSGKSRLDRLDLPARSLLRLRCAFGANARAEVLLELLARGPQADAGSTVLALSEVGYSKRNIAFVLDDLVLAGILACTREGNRVRYRLADHAGLERVLRPLPRTPGRWHMRLPIVASFLELAARLRGRDAVVQGIEARKTLAQLRPRIAAAGFTASMPTAIPETYWSVLQQWLVDHLIAEDGDTRHHVAGMIEGVWVDPNRPIRRPQRFTSAMLPRTSSDPINDDELQCLDLVQVPTVDPQGDWAWGVLSTAATSTYAHTIGLNNGESWRFATWAWGEPCVYSVVYDEPLPYDQITRLYGDVAAARARHDRPAVQLRLKRIADTPR